jgi:hypothetical protein
MSSLEKWPEALASYLETTGSLFHLPGLVRQSQDTVEVSLRPFNDRQYNRDLAALCERVNAAASHLPDGRLLSFTVQDMARPI